MMLPRQSVWLIAPIVALVMRLASVPTANMSYLVIAAYAFLGRAQAIQALAMSWLFGMLNPGIAPVTTLDSVGRYAVMTAAAASVFLRSGMLRRSSRVTWLVVATGLLGGFMVVHSLVVSPMVMVSVLKALSWMLVMTTSFSAWGGLSQEVRAATSNHIFGGLVVIMVASLPLLILPTGYLRNGSGFQGIFAQPQQFGPTMALLCAWAASRMFADARSSWRLLMLAGICLVLVVLSEARTAGLALVLGVGVAVITIPMLAGRPVRSILPGIRNRRAHLVLLLSLAGALLAGPLLTDRLGLYLVKRDQSGTIAESFEASRGGLVSDMWANIRERPLSGIGFGIASVPEDMIVVYDPVLNLPISASIEKGVLPIAVLEELGIVGFLLVWYWFWIMIKRATKGGVAPLTVVLTAMLLNMGEYTLFSPGGLGMITLILFGWAATSAQRKAGYA